MTNTTESNGNKGKPARTVKVLGILERAVDEVDRALVSGCDVLIDLSGCKMITVDGIEWLEELLLRASSAGANVRIVNVPPPIYKVFKVAHIDSIQKACGAPGPSGPVC